MLSRLQGHMLGIHYQSPTISLTAWPLSNKNGFCSFLFLMYLARSILWLNLCSDGCQCNAGRENRDLNIIIFKEVLDNIARVERVLTMPGGSLLLAGRSGVGRRTAVLLVAHMHHMELITPKINRGYSIKQFKIDLKTVAVVLIWLFYRW